MFLYMSCVRMGAMTSKTGPYETLEESKMLCWNISEHPNWLELPASHCQANAGDPPTPTVSMDDASWILAKAGGKQYSTVLAALKGCWFTTEFNEWWWLPYTPLLVGWWGTIYGEWWKHVSILLWNRCGWQPVEHLPAISLQRRTSNELLITKHCLAGIFKKWKQYPFEWSTSLP